VLVLDANPGPGGVGELLDIDRANDLEIALRHGVPLQHSVAPGPDGIWLMPVAKGLERVARMDEASRRRALESVVEFARPMDVVLMDAAGPDSAAVFGQVADEVVVIVAPGAEGVTDAYALIKRLKYASARTEFSVVLTRVANERSARAIFENIARVAGRYLGATLAYAGFVPADARIPEAAKLQRSVVEAFPGARASASFRHLAGVLCRHRGTREAAAQPGGAARRTAQAAAFSHGAPCIQ